jgi:ornithine cyclodeaminase/alanine dehydrogenase-like protein (mu-crystallin family)
MTFRFLTEDQVRQVLPASEFPALVNLMADTLVDFSADRATQPVRTALPVGPPGQYLGIMPALLPEAGALGAKLVSVVPSNPGRGLSSHIGVVVLFDPETGALRAVMDARYITEVRTAAVSAVSMRHMARPDATRLALVGAGVQARSHLDVFSAVRRLSQVRVWSPDAAEVEAFVRDASNRLALDVRAAGSAREAVREADLVVLATSADRPVVQSDWIADGTHVVSVGACRPHQREMDPRLVARSRVVVDSLAAALVESGDIVMGIAEGHFTREHLAGELGAVAAGRVDGRTGIGEVTVFKSLGLAVEDVAAGHLAARRADARRIGLELSLEG